MVDIWQRYEVYLGFQSLVYQFDLKYLYIYGRFLDTNDWYASNEGLDDDYDGCDQHISYVFFRNGIIKFQLI
jgi:hypothetical protein